MHRRVAGLLLACALAGSPAAAEEGNPPGGGGPAPPPAPGGPAAPAAPDLRFFPKDLADALKALQDPAGDEETRYDALLRISRMRGLEGATDPLKKDAWGPVLEFGLATTHESTADLAGSFLAALDRAALVPAARKAAETGADGIRLRNAACLAEHVGGPEGIALLAGPLASAGSPLARARAVEALGLLRAKEGFAAAAALMRDGDLRLRNVAALALGRIGDPKAAPLLLAGLGEMKAQHSWFCATALGSLEDPALFDAVLARPAGGAAVGPKAKAVEVCARPANVDALVNLVLKGSVKEIRSAAANALGRLAGEDSAGPESTVRLQPGQRQAVADALLEGVASDREPDVRASCHWALRRCSTPKTGPDAFDRLKTVQGDDKTLFLLTVLGERKDLPAAMGEKTYREFLKLLLQRGILGSKQVMVRRAAAVTFWQVADGTATKEFRAQVAATSDAGTLERLAEAVGSWRSKEGFETAVTLLRSTREGSREQLAVLYGLEKMTGHWFGPSPGTWFKWFEANPHFFTPKQEKLDREKWREEFDRENKQGWRHTAETEKAVQMGLSWISRHQAPDGIWDATGVLDQCDPKAPCSKQAGGRTQFSQAGTSGLPTLAFTGAGYGPASGKYRHTIRRALDALRSTVNVDGDFEQADLLWNRSYSRPIAMQALAEGYAGTGDPDLRHAAEHILSREFALMNERGGWRYSLHREVPELDSSVTAWVVFAVKAAEKAGIPVPRLLWEGPYLAFDFMSQRVPASQEYYEEIPKDAGDYGVDVTKGKTYVFQTGYTDPSGGPGRATTPLGLMSRIFLGWKRTHPFCIGSANYIKKHYLPEFDVFGEPFKEDWSRAGKFAPQAIWPMYNIYYCTLAMHQMGGKDFGDWNRRVGRVLPRFQRREGCERGVWPAEWGRDSAFGWLYTTSMGVLTLETYYRYLPILQD